MNIYLSGRTKSELISRLMVALLFAYVIPAMAYEAAVPADVPESIQTEVPADAQDVMPQTIDGDVSLPRVRKFVKPNRSLMKASVANTKVGYAFLDDNQHKPGIVKLKSGLQYKILKVGAGAKPVEEDVVKCKYRGTLVDGTVFEQSEPGKLATIKVAPLVPGLKEAIKLMPIGSKWVVYIPSELGFASAGKPPKVGPEAVLIYDLELVGINAPSITKPQ
jgi:FKBP-type peptidyl-prolyl cis-trans isomerase